MPEITDEELASLRTGNALLDRLLKSPKTKRVTERAIKELHPDTVISDDFEKPIHDELKALRDELAAERKTRAEREQDHELETKFGKLRQDGGYTDEGLEKVKKIMVERKIADPLDAAVIYEKLNPPPEPQKPSGFGGTSWGFGAKGADKDVDLLFDDEDAWAEKEAHAHFNELAAGK